METANMIDVRPSFPAYSVWPTNDFDGCEVLDKQCNTVAVFYGKGSAELAMALAAKLNAREGK